MGEIIPFPVCIIPIPVLKIYFELFGNYEVDVLKEVVLIRGLEVGEIIPFPVCIIPFPVFKINFGLLGKNKKQAGAELGQAQLKLELELCLYCSSWIASD